MATTLLVQALVAVAMGAGIPPVPASHGSERAAHLRRGDEVEIRYRAHREELERLHAALDGHLAQRAPDLRARILPPAPVPYGYGILPGLLAEAPAEKGQGRIITSPFSWVRTEALIVRDQGRSASLFARLGTSASGDPGRRREDDESFVAEYLKLVDAQKLVEAQIQYNRLWQGEVARTPGFYAEARALQEAALERERLLAAPPAPDVDAPARRARVDELSRRIDAAIAKKSTSAFVRVEQTATRSWVIRVPLFTDIDDDAFVERFRAAVESSWHVRDGEDEFAVEVEVKRVSPALLYPDGPPPERGAHIDVASHLARFPPDGAVLTTGANTIYSLGRGIVLGPHAVGPSALVHEFGHQLGFRDGYFRSFEDLDEDGYEIVEVILDPDEVVAAPERGRVRREHFEQVLRERLP